MEYKNLSIYIRTYKRPNQQKTLRNLPPEIAKETYLVVRESELEAHKQYSEKCKEILAMPAVVNNISKTIQWIYDHCTTKYIAFLDDDLSFNVRRSATEWNMRKMQPEDFTIMLDSLMAKAKSENAAHVAVSAQEFNRRYFEPWQLNTRYMRFYIYDKEILTKEKIEVARMSTKHDFDTALQLVRKGYPAYVNYWFSQQQDSSNSKGGCSEERAATDSDGLKESELLKSFHQDFVSVVKKKTKHSWNGKERFDVRIQWEKAYRSAPKCGGCHEPLPVGMACCEPVSARQLHPQ